jgi:hypothetical protein
MAATLKARAIGKDTSLNARNISNQPSASQVPSV